MGGFAFSFRVPLVFGTHIKILQHVVRLCFTYHIKILRFFPAKNPLPSGDAIEARHLRNPHCAVMIPLK